MGLTCLPHGFPVAVIHTVSPMGHTFVHPIGLSIASIYKGAPGTGRYVNPMGTGSQRDTGATSCNSAMLIICIWPVFGTTIRPKTNSLFGLLLRPNRIRTEYSVQP